MAFPDAVGGGLQRTGHLAALHLPGQLPGTSGQAHAGGQQRAHDQTQAEQYGRQRRGRFGQQRWGGNRFQGPGETADAEVGPSVGLALTTAFAFLGVQGVTAGRNR
jgi:hypothetical protein